MMNRSFGSSSITRMRPVSGAGAAWLTRDTSNSVRAWRLRARLNQSPRRAQTWIPLFKGIGPGAGDLESRRANTRDSGVAAEGAGGALQIALALTQVGPKQPHGAARSTRP